MIVFEWFGEIIAGLMVFAVVVVAVLTVFSIALDA